MASNRVKTRELKSGEIVAYSESAIRNNASAVEYCRTSMAALSGSTAGEIYPESISVQEVFQTNNMWLYSSIPQVLWDWLDYLDSSSIWLLCSDYGACCCWNQAQIGKNILSAERAFSLMVFSVVCVRTCYFGHFCSGWFTYIKNVTNNKCSTYLHKFNL